MDPDDLATRQPADTELTVAFGSLCAGDTLRAEEELSPGDGTAPTDALCRTFESPEGYDGMVLLRDIGFEGRSERDTMPVTGVVHIAYLPSRRMAEASDLARVVAACAGRPQLQERLTAQIANTIDAALRPEGVAVAVEARHHGMTTHGGSRPEAVVSTSRTLGVFRTHPDLRREFHMLIGWRS